MITESTKPAGYRSLLTVSFTALLAGQIGSILGDRLHHMAFIELIAAETSRFADPASAFELSPPGERRLLLGSTALVLLASYPVWKAAYRRRKDVTA